ncbi:MAG TPA: MFS transporter [Methylomirabilota bacterium]|nr:MFS transporter [Methylomirabilota bacterium]
MTETVSWGIVYYGFPAFLQSMEADLGASRVAVTGALSVGLAVSALAALPVGRWLDRHGPRALMTFGSCLGTALVVAWSRVDSLAALYAVWLLLGIAMATTLYEPAFAVVVSWFPRQHRDRALLTLTLTAGLASTIFMPLEAWLIGRLGWRTALLTLAAVLGVVTIPLHALVLRPGPGGAAGPPAGPTGHAPAAGMTLGAAVRTPVFWVLAASFFVTNFATVSLTTHLIPFLTERGYSATVAAATIGWIGAMQLPGRLLFVPVSAWLGPRWSTAGVFFAQAVSLAQLALLGRLVPTLVPIVLLLGAANGMSTLARATSLAEIFGARHYGSISGAVGLAANGARAAGPVGAAALWLALGGYAPTFWVLGGALAAAGLAVLLTPAKD